jgi:hypothetical protein
MSITRGLLAAFALALVLTGVLVWSGPRAPGAAPDPTSDDTAAAPAAPDVAAPQPLRQPTRFAAIPSDRRDGDINARPPGAPIDPAESSFSLVRSTLADAIEAHLPSLKLSGSELDALADATLRMRSAQQSLRTLPERREHAMRRAEARRLLEQAIVDFTYVAEMGPAEFTRRVQPDFGIDWPTADDTGGEVLIHPIVPADERE